LVRSENFKGDGVFKIYDARGRIVKNIQFEEHELIFHLDMKETADGVYIIRSNDSNWSLRFVIAK
jgi:antitoxin component YwqK of YwqJK toxin-antitoxin module